MALTDKVILNGAYSDNTDPLSAFETSQNPFYGNDLWATAQLGMDPYVTGYAFIYWISLPSWFQKDDDLKHFKVFTQKNLKAFSGITDPQLTFATQQTGFNGNDVNFVSDVTRGNTDFSMSFKEYTGTPMRNMFRKWENYIRDPNTGIALYPSVFNVDYGSRNSSAQLLFINMRPDVKNTSVNNIENAILWSNVLPVNDPMGALFNYTQGEQDSPAQVDIDFHGVPDYSPAVTDYAKTILKSVIVNSDTSNTEGSLFISALAHAGDDDSDSATGDLYKKIYGTTDD